VPALTLRTSHLSLRSAGVVLAAAFGLLSLVPPTMGATPEPQPEAAGPVAPVELGSLLAFGIVAGPAGVSNTGSSVISGDLASPKNALIGFPPGRVTGMVRTGGAAFAAARADLAAAYEDAAGRQGATTVAGDQLAGSVLVPGLYRSAGVLSLTGALTLDGKGDLDAVWIFQSPTDLLIAASSSITFRGGAQACNVYWQVTRSASVGADSRFAGTILAGASIVLGGHLELTGRALVRDGGVIMMNDAILRSTCARSGPTAAPASAATPAPSPTTPVVEGLAVVAPAPPPPAVSVQGFGSGPTIIFALVLLPIVVFATRRWWPPVRIRRRGPRGDPGDHQGESSSRPVEPDLGPGSHHAGARGYLD
jgi:hypothetical protein